ncbi:MAG: prepilin-type N-terminal cleavage/methylation domain-containing protein [Candidatus Aureabacteria bacterium]|nr:prepilin-type N-terminal cleavage/methylation domain-containing protein [Candidatus Auribacterota bacterium]
MKKVRPQKGFTLMELLIMIIIAGMAMPPLVALLILINQESTTIIPYVEPSVLAIQLMEEIKGKKWDENWIGGKLEDADKTSPGSLGADSGESTRTLYDDMDDYININPIPQDIHGNNLPQYQDYRVTVGVYYVRGLGTTLPLNPGSFDFSSVDTTNPPVSNYKRIDVTITKNSQVVYRVSTVACNY